MYSVKGIIRGEDTDIYKITKIRDFLGLCVVLLNTLNNCSTRLMTETLRVSRTSGERIVCSEILPPKL